MLETILITTDGSNSARNAADVGIQIASAGGAHIKSLYIVDESLVLDSYADYSNELGKDVAFASRSALIEGFRVKGEEALDEIQNSAKKRHVHLEKDVLFGGVPELIQSKAADAQLLTIGRRGNRHPTDVQHLGSNFRYVYHHTDIPILAGGETCPEIHRIFVVFDEKRKSHRALKWAIHLNQIMCAEIIIGWIPKDGETGVSPEFEERIKASGLKSLKQINLGTASGKVISEIAEKENVDLIIVKGYHNPEFIDLLMGNPIDELLKHCSLPVLLT